MAISRERKEELVAKYTDLLEASNGFAVVQTSGMTVPQVEALRKKILEAGGQYVVTKKTLMKIALQNHGWEVSDDLFEGPISVAFGKEDFPGVAKALLNYIKDENADEMMAVSGGMMTGDLLNSDQVKAISDLPSLDELRAQLAGLFVSPAQGLVNVLYAGTAGVVNVIQAYVDKEGEGDDAA